MVSVIKKFCWIHYNIWYNQFVCKKEKRKMNENTKLKGQGYPSVDKTHCKCQGQNLKKCQS